MRAVGSLNVHALLAAGVNADGHREILGLQATSGEDGAGWLAFFRDLTARGLTGVQLVTSDAHAGLVVAIGATLPGASWQRCRTHRGHKNITCSGSTPHVSLRWCDDDWDPPGPIWLRLPGAPRRCGGLLMAAGHTVAMVGDSVNDAPAPAHADQPATPGDGATPLGGHLPAGGHSTLTMCLAVLGSLAALVLLVASALARRPAVVDPPDGVHPVGVRFSLGRPPPWTVPSLHQLSLLRV